jgi:uncharacterized protein (UPF0335 family)
LKYSNSVDLQTVLQDQISDIVGHLEMLKDQGEKNVEDIRSIFAEARRLLDERESQIISGFSKLYDREEITLGERRMMNKQQIDVI